MWECVGLCCSYFCVCTLYLVVRGALMGPLRNKVLHVSPFTFSAFDALHEPLHCCMKTNCDLHFLTYNSRQIKRKWKNYNIYKRYVYIGFEDDVGKKKWTKHMHRYAPTENEPITKKMKIQRQTSSLRRCVK